MSIRDVADRASDNEDDEPAGGMVDADVLPHELCTQEDGQMIQFSSPTIPGVNDSARWLAIDKSCVVDLEEAR